MIRQSKYFVVVAASAIALIASPAFAQAAPVHGGYKTVVSVSYSEVLSVDGVVQSTKSAQPLATYGPKSFTPQSTTFAQSDSNGAIQAAYNYASPQTFSWRYEVNPTICTGGVMVGGFVANIYNNGGLVPNTHYSKVGVDPCYGFHASFPGNTKINNKGTYQLSGGETWTRNGKRLDLNFYFNFIITYV